LDAVARNDLAAGPVVEIFENYPRIIVGGAILGDQRRDFAERILPKQRTVQIHRVRRLNFHIVETEHRQCDLDLSAER
jgi:hypothetical protein